MKVSYHPAKFGYQRHCDSEDNDFTLSRDLRRPRVQRVV